MAANKPSTSSIDVDGDTRHHVPSQSASPVDGRWAVVVVIAAFIGRAIVSMQSSSMPLLTVEWEKRLGVTPSQVSWASTLATSPRFLIAPVAGALNRKFGCRPIVFVGGFCAMTSILLLSMTNKLWQIFICSCLIGTSMGLVYQGTVIVVSVYFDKWLGRANGLAYSGVGMGIMAGSPLMALLIEVFTWRGALLIMAGLVANLSVTAAVYRPLTWWSKRKKDTKGRNAPRPLTNDYLEDEDAVDGEIEIILNLPADSSMNSFEHGETVELQPLVSVVDPAHTEDPLQVVRNGPDDTVIYPDVQSEIAIPKMDRKEDIQPRESIKEFQTKTSLQHDNNTESKRNSCQYCAVKCRQFINDVLDLFGFNLLWKNSNVLLLCLIATFQGGGYFPSYVYLPSYIVSSGVSELRASFIFTILGLCSLVGRLTHGFLLDFKLITPTKLYGLTSVLAGCSLYIIVTFGTYPAFVVYAIIFGLSTGAQIPLCPVLTKKYTAPSELASAFGLQSFFTGISQLLGTYLLGLLFDWTNDYRSCFCLTGALLCIAGVIGFLIDPWIRWRHRLDEEIGDGI
ncbi:monocarboxylate transporter 9-like [Strongylocentrotus purpuratus]|uniref:Major facilitator superfamily (MFS) profile domain-containing protein n=1 Tax=Strongylocentrotus purpuratus TaxID=7668 RepID=A0A7M7NMC7_STRPU|nr:monocarboxylate transporter 9-like [Strongylocentrotus purpuratus]XP_030837780.1 monocarboxylate transporter 9-like [Strongylocentrotus purpuratus]